MILRLAISVQGLALHSPLTKVLAGLELLVAKCQDWEGNASRFVSIATDMAALSSVVARWRRLELKSWEELLEVRQHVYRRQARAWWLKLYDVLICGDFYTKGKDVAVKKPGV